MRRAAILCIVAGLGAAGCSRRDDPSPPFPLAERSLNAAEISSPGIADKPIAPVGGDPEGAAFADLEAVATGAAAFADMIQKMREFAGEELEYNPGHLDLPEFVRGKSERDLLKFTEAVQYKSPFASMQVLDHLLRHSADPKIRMEAAWRFGDVAAGYGDARDRARGAECFEMLADMRADDAFVATLSDRDRIELLTGMQRLQSRLDLGRESLARMAAVYRAHAHSDEDLAYADWFDAMALLRHEDPRHLPQMIEHLRAIRDRGVYGRYFAGRDVIERWLEKDADEVAVGHAEFHRMQAHIRARREGRGAEEEGPAP